MAWTTRRNNNFPRVVIDFDTPAAVSTETPLLALTEYGPDYQSLAFTLRNHDPANRAAFYIEQSESGLVNDEDREALYVGALKERTFEFRDILRLMWGLTAAGDPDAAFPSVLVSWRVVGRIR